MQTFSNYRSPIPFPVYARLLTIYPMRDGESEASWLKRIRQDISLPQRIFGTDEFKHELSRAVQRRQKDRARREDIRQKVGSTVFKDELAQGVQRRAMAQAGARRMGQASAGPSLVTIAPGRLGAPLNTIAPRYRDEFIVGGHQYRFADEAYDWLLEQFDAATPVNGSIFWNGINELALAKLVEQWNTELRGEIFGQLEATTAARYVNKQFYWEEGGRFQQYFKDVSDRLGHEAKGHVTSVVRCGLRYDSIFTVTELPRMLGSMEDQIRQRLQPTITDLTIVVIEPKTMPERSVATYTNNEITMIPIVKPVPAGGRINRREDCEIEGHVGLSARVRNYWTGRGSVGESAAAKRIRTDFGRLIKWP